MSSLTEIQLSAMLEMQDEMNCKVNPDWVAAGNNWYRAIQVEGVEAIEHHGWKWWKKQECDWAQLRMELVDIWHFILSAAIQHKHGDTGEAGCEMLSELGAGTNTTIHYDGRDHSLPGMKLLDKLDLLVGLAAARRSSLALFESVLEECGMDWNELFRQYLGKNVLNMFRQDHGYKSGEYIKIWEGREDNEHLVEILDMADLSAADVRDVLYRSLADRYRQSAECLAQ